MVVHTIPSLTPCTIEKINIRRVNEKQYKMSPINDESDWKLVGKLWRKDVYKPPIFFSTRPVSYWT